MSSALSFFPRLLLLAVGCGLLLRAGRLEAEGRLDEARRSARHGGFLGALGSLIAAVGVAALPAIAGGSRGIAAACFLGAGAAGLLAGLSGKPRPTGWAAMALLVAGVVVALIPVR